MGHDLGTWVVTGAGGYLGQHTCSLLGEARVPFVPLARTGPDACDLLEPNTALRKAVEGQSVLHLAAAVPSTAAGYQEEASARANLTMVENLLDCGPTRVVFASSMTVYPRDAHMPVRESDASDPDSAYGRSKLQAEEALTRSGVPSVSLRLPGLFGPPRITGLVAVAIRALASKGAFETDADPPPWTTMHVQDAAAMCIRALRLHNDGHLPLNIGYDQPMSVPTAIQIIADALGVASAPGTQAPSFAMDLTASKRWLGAPPRDFASAVQDYIPTLLRGLHAG